MQPQQLIDHPEGGRFQEVFRSATVITTSDGKSRTALTHIYFSLNKGERSRFHKVTADEIWNLYCGKGVRIYTWDGSHNPPQCIELSAGLNNFCHVIPAGQWQAAEPIGESVLVGCSVGPGFEFDDFTLMQTDSAEARQLRSIAPDLAAYC